MRAGRSRHVLLPRRRLRRRPVPGPGRDLRPDLPVLQRGGRELRGAELELKVVDAETCAANPNDLCRRACPPVSFIRVDNPVQKIGLLAPWTSAAVDLQPVGRRDTAGPPAAGVRAGDAEREGRAGRDELPDLPRPRGVRAAGAGGRRGPPLHDRLPDRLHAQLRPQRRREARGPGPARSLRSLRLRAARQGRDRDPVPVADDAQPDRVMHALRPERRQSAAPGISTRTGEGFRSGVSQTSRSWRRPTPTAARTGARTGTGTTSSTPGENQAGPWSTSGLDQNWGTGGGCGFMTGTSATQGGIWHTGHIGAYNNNGGAACRPNESICEEYDTNNGTLGQLYWFEMLRTPSIHPISLGPDSADGYEWKTQILDWAWNMQHDQNARRLRRLELELRSRHGQRRSHPAGLRVRRMVLDQRIRPGHRRPAQSHRRRPRLRSDRRRSTAQPPKATAINGTKGSNRAASAAAGSTTSTRSTSTAAARAPRRPPFGEGANPKPRRRRLRQRVRPRPRRLPRAVRRRRRRERPGRRPARDLPVLPLRRGRAQCRQAVLLPCAVQHGRHDQLRLPVHHASATGGRTPYGDDLCGDGSTDETLAATFGTNTSLRQDAQFQHPANRQRLRRREHRLQHAGGLLGASRRHLGGRDRILRAGVEPARRLPAGSYGMAIDDMVIEWQELHPVAQVGNTCASAGNPGFRRPVRRSSASGSTTVSDADGVIPVTVIDPVATDNLVNCDGDPEHSRFRSRPSPDAERTPESYCLDPVGTAGIEFRGDGQDLFPRRPGRGTGRSISPTKAPVAPAVTVRYLDRNDGKNVVSNGPDGGPGVAGFDDDGDGTVDDADELCPQTTRLAPGRTPHLPGSAGPLLGRHLRLRRQPCLRQRHRRVRRRRPADRQRVHSRRSRRPGDG